MRDDEVLGAGDPGALEALFGLAAERAADRALAEAYRRWGWLSADLEPLRATTSVAVPELDPMPYGLTNADAAPLRAAYCGSIGWEFGHLQDATCRNWLAGQAEEPWVPAEPARQRALDLIARGEHLEATFDRRLPGAKTFGLSGAEGYLVLLDAVLTGARVRGAVQAVIGGMHRGRLTQMGLVFGKPLVRLITDARGVPEYPEALGASSDSPYHLGWSGQAETADGALDVWVAPHPSHLSVVAPVALGYARGLRGARHAVLPLALHTDAAFAGQGVNAELLQLSGLSPFEVGGTLHLILDNQIGFTTAGPEARTARTAADFAKVVEAPILHVNGDDPDAILRVAKTAIAWRAHFGTDIVINLLTYRRKGHNEIDQPRFTQPGMYRRIDALPPLSHRYSDLLARTPDLAAFSEALDQAFAAAKDWRPNTVPAAPGLAPGMADQMLAPVVTGVARDGLQALGDHLTDLPPQITPHSKVADFLDGRRAAVALGESLDWATAEALALASLAEEGTEVRFGGQDSVRGAFTQRHLAVHCQRTEGIWQPLQGLSAPVEIFNTPLTESAVLGFEYGHSVAAPDSLTVWEAQFGDFLNVAQAIFDQFIICGEDRWLFRSGLTLLLPHGVDGGGPDHATAHPERLLAACAQGNIQVANPSTPANYFHALRRQVRAPWRKPLVVLAPKTLLRHPSARSPLSAFEGCFQTVMIEDRPARRAVMATGKLAVLLEAERDRRGSDVALIRLEQLYPLDLNAIRAATEGYDELVWAQEEPENFGYFTWLDRRLESATGRRWTLVSRAPSPSASAGPKSWDDVRLKAVIDEALGDV